MVTCWMRRTLGQCVSLVFFSLSALLFPIVTRYPVLLNFVSPEQRILTSSSPDLCDCAEMLLVSRNYSCSWTRGGNAFRHLEEILSSQKQRKQFFLLTNL